MPPKEVSWPELSYPTNRNKTITVDGWIEGKKTDDGAENLWRIHDGLYDLTDFIKKHPGGSMWLELTKGTDITEAFESYHITDRAENLKKKFYVRPANSPRNSPYVFDSNGFYETLKAKVNRYFRNKSPELTVVSRLSLDLTVILALFSAVMAARYNSYYLATFSGFMFCMIVNCGHNLVHKKDTWRIYYLYLTSFSVREFRISHCISHHLFTNTIQDLEISMFEPLFQFLPQPDKTFVVRYLSWIYFPFALASISFNMIFKRIYTKVFTRYDLIILIVPALMLLFGNQPFLPTILMWSWIVMLVGFFFGLIGFTAAHHHPKIFHEGDIPRKDRDWGLQQIDAVQDRVEIHGSVYIGLFLFGEHTLHHLFPSIDHALLPQLYPLLKETLDEFGIKIKMNTIPNLIVGALKQLARIEKNKIGD